MCNLKSLWACVAEDEGEDGDEELTLFDFP